MPAELNDNVIRAAKTAINNARRVRETHARHSPRGSQQREADINIALERLKTAMKPLRSEIGRFPYGPKTETAEANRQVIYRLSQNIQKERRKLWKMQNH